MFTQTHTRIFCFFLLCLTYCHPTTNCQAQTTFGPQQIISTNANAAISVYAIDLDGDGDNDVLSASNNDNKIAHKTIIIAIKKIKNTFYIILLSLK